MKYIVIKKFHEDFITLMPGDMIELTEERARHLREHVRESEEREKAKPNPKKGKKK